MLLIIVGKKSSYSHLREYDALFTLLLYPQELNIGFTFLLTIKKSLSTIIRLQLQSHDAKEVRFSILSSSFYFFNYLLDILYFSFENCLKCLKKAERLRMQKR